MKQSQAMQDHLAMVANLMSHQMQSFVTPISGAISDRTATHVGTGGYIDWHRQRLLLTNEHVARDINEHSLARKCFDSPDYIHINNPFKVLGAPQDIAVSDVDDRWNVVPHSAMAFPDYRFEKVHAPVQAEYLFLMGFTGEKAHYSPSFETLFTTGTPYLTQEYDPTLEPEENQRVISHPDFNPEHHFAMHWNPEQTTSTGGNTNSIPIDPHGMSGSFVWNTRFVELARLGQEWTPGVARLTGILWGWDTSNRFLFATRIEQVSRFLSSICS